MVEAAPFSDRRTRVAERARRREAVLLAAVRMFNARGFTATSLDDVAASLGVTKPVVYHHFRNKEQLLLACLTAGLDELAIAAEAAALLPGSGLDRLRAFLCRYAEVNMGEYGRCVIRTGEELLSPESRAAFRTLKRGIDATLRAMIERAVADGSAAVPDVRFAGFAIAGALNWPARWQQEDGAVPREAVAERLVDFLTAGLRPRGEGSSSGEAQPASTSTSSLSSIAVTRTTS